MEKSMLARGPVLSLVVVLGGCLGPAQFRGWSEPPYHYARCTGAPTGLAACLEQASARCREGYQLAEVRSDPPINRHAIIFRCGTAPPQPAPPAPSGPPK